MSDSESSVVGDSVLHRLKANSDGHFYTLRVSRQLDAERPNFRTVRDPSETGRDCSDRRLHCEDGTEPGLAFRNAFVGLWCLCQWIRLDDCFNFSLRYEIQGFVEIFGPVLLTANDPNALHDEVHQRNRKRLRVGAHSDKPAVRPQSLNAIHH